MYQSEEYREIDRRQTSIFYEMVGKYSRKIVIALEAYTTAMLDQTELERRHFFEQGYLAAARENPPL